MSTPLFPSTSAASSNKAPRAPAMDVPASDTSGNDAEMVVTTQPATSESVRRTKVAENVKKELILREYQEFCKRRGYEGSTVIQRAGKRTNAYANELPSVHRLVSDCVMKPAANKYYRVGDLQVCNVMIQVVDGGYISPSDLVQVKKINVYYRDMVDDIMRLKDIDFTPLLYPRVGFRGIKEIEEGWVDMTTALLIHYGGHPGLATRFLGWEYTGETRDYEKVFKRCQGIVDQEDIKGMIRVLTEGCPASIDFEDVAEQKMRLLRRGNNLSWVRAEQKLKDKAMLKMHVNSFTIPVREWVCYMSPYCRHTPQGFVKGKRPVFDASTKMLWDDLVLNEVTTTDFEAAITFGPAKMNLFKRIYNTRISLPQGEILLAMADIKSCYKFGCVHPDCAGLFGHVTDSLYFIANRMVFGSNTSSPSWEPHRRAIEQLTSYHFSTPGLVEKHQKYLDMLTWDDTPLDVDEIVRAVPCELNRGITDENGELLPPRADMYVDDALLSAPGKENMKRVLAAIIESIFWTMGEPIDEIRENYLSLEKWDGMLVSYQKTMLGLEVNTRGMWVGMTDEYKQQVLELLDEKWNPNNRFFILRDMYKLVGKVARMGEGAPWIYKVISHLYVSLAFALKSNEALLDKLDEPFHKLLHQIKTKNFYGSARDVAKQVNHAMKLASRQVAMARFRYPINQTMRDEIEFIASALRTDSIKFRTPLAFIVKRAPTWTIYGDSSLKSCGGYSLGLRFWWYVPFSEKLKERTLIYRKNGEEGLISINVFEFLTVIVSYCAARCVIEHDGLREQDPYPVVLNVTDNRSASRWTEHTAKSSLEGRALARFLCGLMIKADVGLNSKWISTTDNAVADDISRIKAEAKQTKTNFIFDFSQLQQKYPALKACRFFQPSARLLSMLEQTILTRKCPSLDEVMAMEPSDFGKLCT